MSGSCFGSDDTEENVDEADETGDTNAASVPCTDNIVMYFTQVGGGWWRTRDTWLTSGTIVSAPQHLKVLVDGPKSCQGDRHFYTILEGPRVKNGTHFREGLVGRKGNVAKTSDGTATLTTTNPHTAACDITVAYSSYDTRTATGSAGQEYVAASVYGSFTFAGVTKDVRMQLDVIAPNQSWKLSIPDFPHPGGDNYSADLGTVWFRVDAPTSPVDWTGHGAGNDRYFHLGRGSAGCFTNVTDDGSDAGYDTIAGAMMKCRDGSDLYVGQIKFDIPSATYTLIAKARRGGISYVWNNQVHAP